MDTDVHTTPTAGGQPSAPAAPIATPSAPATDPDVAAFGNDPRLNASLRTPPQEAAPAPASTEGEPAPPAGEAQPPGQQAALEPQPGTPPAAAADTRSPAEKRIAKLVAEREAERARAAELERRLQSLEAQRSQPAQPPPGVPQNPTGRNVEGLLVRDPGGRLVAPTEEDAVVGGQYDHARFLQMQGAYGAASVMDQQQQVSRQQQQAAARERVRTDFANHEATFAEAHPDYDDVLNEALPILWETRPVEEPVRNAAGQYTGEYRTRHEPVRPRNPVLVEAVMAMGADGPAVAYELSRDPETAARLAQTRDPTRLMFELGQVLGRSKQRTTTPPARPSFAPPPQTPNYVPGAGGGPVVPGRWTPERIAGTNPRDLVPHLAEIDAEIAAGRL